MTPETARAKVLLGWLLCLIFIGGWRLEHYAPSLAHSFTYYRIFHHG